MQDDSQNVPAAGSGFQFATQSIGTIDLIPALPTLAATRVQMELLLKDSLIDLKAVAEVILADAGATVQVYRLTGEEYPNGGDRPVRIEDCIVNLSMERCYQAICNSDVTAAGPCLTEWQRCRRIAVCARELARSLEGFPPEEAYLVGLLYRLGTFPQLLGWKVDSHSLGENNALGVMLANHWCLPSYLVQAIDENHREVEPAKWKALLNLAHQLSEQPLN